MLIVLREGYLCVSNSDVQELDRFLKLDVAVRIKFCLFAS